MTANRKPDVSKESAFLAKLRGQIKQVIVGQDGLVDRILLAVLCDGHLLLEGLPGLAKTLAVKATARAIKADFRRIQFTPDLLPADLVGTMVFNPKSGSFSPKQGPVFTNLLLADEINRAPAKVQSALLEAMQERQVTIGDASYPVPVPFLVLATQNPIEHEGTYPLPEAQVDRFMLKIRVDYPEREEERQILRLMSSDELAPVEAVATPEEILRARAMLPDIRLDERVENYILDLVRATRDAGAIEPELGRWVEYGASPRASIFLARTARANAFLEGRPFTVPEDVRAFALDVLRHRIMLTFEAEAELITSEEILDRVLAAVPIP